MTECERCGAGPEDDCTDECPSRLKTVIIRGDARAMPFIDTDAVDLIVTSPPYWGLRSYRDAGEHYGGQVGSEDTPQQFVDELVSMIDSEWRRVLKPVGSLWLNLGDKYSGSGGDKPQSGGLAGSAASDKRDTRRYGDATTMAPKKSLMGVPWRVALALIDAGWILRAEVIWSKPNGLPESVTDRVRRSHEQWFHFTIEPQYFSAVDEIREPHAEVSINRTKPHRAQTVLAHEDSHEFDMGKAPHALGRLPGSVWTIPTEPLLIPDAVREQLGLVDHFAAFPQEWPRRLIRAFAPEGGVVLDPFGGTGTTAGVARVLGRSAISVDLSNDYCRLARWRVFQSDHFSKSEQRTWADKQGTLI